MASLTSAAPSKQQLFFDFLAARDLEQYAPILQENGIDTLGIFSHLKKEHLSQFNIPTVPALALLSAVSELTALTRVNDLPVAAAVATEPTTFREQHKPETKPRTVAGGAHCGTCGVEGPDLCPDVDRQDDHVVRELLGLHGRGCCKNLRQGRHPT